MRKTARSWGWMAALTIIPAIAESQAISIWPHGVASQVLPSNPLFMRPPSSRAFIQVLSYLMLRHTSPQAVMDHQLCALPIATLATPTARLIMAAVTLTKIRPFAVPLLFRVIFQQ